MGGSGFVCDPPNRVTKKARKSTTKQGETSDKKTELPKPPAKQKETATKKQVSKKKVAQDFSTVDSYLPFMSGEFVGEPTVLSVSDLIIAFGSLADCSRSRRIVNPWFAWVLLVWTR